MLSVSSKNPWILICLVISVFLLLPNFNPLQAEEISEGEVDLHHLTIITDPPEAKVEILNIDAPYRPNMLLKPGRYHISVSSPGFEPEKGFIDVTDRDWAGKVVLNARLSPTEAVCKNDDALCNDKVHLEQGWQKLGKEKLSLARLRRQLAQEKEKLDLEKEAFEKERQAFLASRKKGPDSSRSVPVSQPSTHQTVESASVVAEVQTVPVASKAPPNPKVTSAPTVSSASTASVVSLLDKAITYLQTPQPPSAPPSPAEKEAALQLLKQALALDPNNDSIHHALKLYEQRYIIHAGLFGEMKRAEKKADMLRPSKLPIYIQPVDVKGKKLLRILVGPFLEKKDALQALQQLKENFYIKDAFLRRYQK